MLRRLFCARVPRYRQQKQFEEQRELESWHAKAMPVNNGALIVGSRINRAHLAQYKTHIIAHAEREKRQTAAAAAGDLSRIFESTNKRRVKLVAAPTRGGLDDDRRFSLYIRFLFFRTQRSRTFWRKHVRPGPPAAGS